MKNLLWILLLYLGLANTAFAQNFTVQGMVRDQDGNTLPGVNVVLKGTQNGTVTDINGFYRLSLENDEAILVFSFIGLKTVEAAVQGRSVIDIKMTDDLQELEEVIFVAYGTSKKEAYTGAAEVVDNKVIENRPVTSFEKALQGTTAGLLVASGSGQPGATAAVRIRGIGSLSAGSSPLYVLDGVPITGGISDINPNDIESLTVLKDAAAASLYGSRAANGVILITTKKGKNTRTQISFGSQVGFSRRISEGYPLMNSTEFYEQSWMGLYNQALINGENVDDARIIARERTKDIVGFNPFGVDEPLDENGKLIPGTRVNTNTDWRDEIYKTGVIQNYNLNLLGGSESSKVYFSLGYFKDGGTVIGSDFERITTKIDLNHRVNKFLTTGINTFLTYSKTNAPPGGSQGANPVRSAEVINAASPVYNDDGSYNWDNKAVFDFNPVGLTELDKYTYNSKRAFVSSFIKIDFLPQLNFKTTATIDYSNDKGLNYYNPNHGNGAGVNGRTSMSQSDNFGWNISNILTYSMERNASFFEVLGGFEALGERYSVISAGVTDFSVPGYYDLVWGAQPESPGSFTSGWNMVSYLGQVKYDYDQRYFATASIRGDGSSRFGENNKFGLFYSLGASWIITKEVWMPATNWLNNLKLRASYGTSGNNNIGNFASLGLYSGGANYGGFPGITPTQLPNRDLSWEKISSLNIGLDVNLVERLSLSAEYYQRNSDGLLFAQPLSAGTGFGSILTNLGAMVNNGFEGTLTYNIIDKQDIFSSIGFNISSNKNKILSLTTDKIVSGTKLLEEGNSVYQFYMREWAGVNPDNGRPMWYVNSASDDRDDNTLPSSAFLDPLGSGRQVTSIYADAERRRMGIALPKVFGGLNYSLTYKNFDFSFFMYYSLGGKVYNVDLANNLHDGAMPGNNLISEARDSWTPDNRFTNVPRYVTNNTDQGSEMSSRYLEDASYLRLKNISLTYHLPQAVIERLRLSGLKLYINAENIFTITSFKGFDPEGALNGTTNNNIPGTKVLTLGLKVDL